MDYSEWGFHDVSPIYIQLVEKIRVSILCGSLLPGTLIPSVRQMAAIIRINPNTVARAYQLVSESGLIESFQHRQYAVTSNTSLISNERYEATKVLCCSYFSNMFALGFSKDEAADAIKQYAERLHFTGTGGGCKSEA